MEKSPGLSKGPPDEMSLRIHCVPQFVGSGHAAGAANKVFCASFGGISCRSGNADDFGSTPCLAMPCHAPHRPRTYLQCLTLEGAEIEWTWEKHMHRCVVQPDGFLFLLRQLSNEYFWLCGIVSFERYYECFIFPFCTFLCFPDHSIGSQIIYILTDINKHCSK